MAKAEWVELSQSSGSGDAAVTVSSKTRHTGRKNRETTLRWTAIDLEPIERKVIQQSDGTMVSIKGNQYSAPHQGMRVVLSGHSNAEALKFSLGAGNLEIAIPQLYTAAGVEIPTKGAYTIPGDPGATESYWFSIVIDVPENTVGEKLTRQIIARDLYDTVFASVMIVSTPLDIYLEIIPEGDITIDADGTPVTVEVRSNTNWVIE